MNDLFIHIERQPMKKLTVCICICLLLAMTGLAQAQEIERYKLDNGLTVVLKQNQQAPVVSVQIWLKAGSDREKPGEQGKAHLLEHMFFKGTDTHPSGQLDHTMENLGAVMNAFTSIKSVVYWVEAKNTHAPLLLDMLADALVNMKLDADELRAEAKVVVEEILLYRDMPDESIWQALLAMNFGPGHPYNKNILGSEDTVLNFKPEDLRDFYARYYCAPNTVLVVAGDFDPAKLKPVIAKAFAALPAGRAPLLEVPPPAVKPGPELLLLQEDVSQATISISFVVPGLNSAEQYALQVACDIMGNGLTSRLYWHLKEDQDLVDDVYASLQFMPQYGIMQITATMEAEQVAKAWQPLINEVYTLLEYPAQSLELERVNKNIKAGMVFNSQSMMEQGYQLGDFELLRDGYENLFSFAEKCRQVNAGAVEQSVFKYLNPKNMRVIIQAPPGSKLPTQDQLESWTQKIWSRVNAPNESENRLVQTLSHGLTLIVENRPSLPMVSMLLAVPHGIAAEPEEMAGINQLWAATVCSANQQYNYGEMAIIQDAKAINLAGHAGANFMGISASSLSLDWQLTLDLLSFCWLQPLFAPDDVERARRMQQLELRRLQDSPAETALQAAQALLFPGHPYGRNPNGNEQALAAINARDIAALHKQLQQTQGAVLAIVGDVSAQEVMARLEQIFAQERPLSLNANNLPLAQMPNRENENLHKSGVNQAHLVLGFHAPDISSEQTYAAQVLAALLNGASGRLHKEIREKQSLAYDVYAFYRPYLLSGMFAVHMGTTAGNQEKALQGLQMCLQQLCEQEVSEQELKRAKSYLLGTQALGRQNHASLAYELATDFMLGRGFDHQQEWEERIQRVSAQDIVALADTLFAKENQVTLILAP